MTNIRRGTTGRFARVARTTDAAPVEPAATNVSIPIAGEARLIECIRRHTGLVMLSHQLVGLREAAHDTWQRFQLRGADHFCDLTNQSGGGASQALVLMTLIKKENGVDLNLIPYKGGGPLNQDILAGVTDVAIGSLTSFSPHVRANKVRALAVTGEQRTPALPDTSTLIEQGVKAFPSYSWWGVYAPTGTPRPIVDRMHAEIKKAVLAPDVTQKFVDQFNMEILTTSPEEFAAYQKSEQERWFKVIKDNDIKGD